MPIPDTSDAGEVPTARGSEPSPTRVELVTETMILPAGCPADGPSVRHWAVYVRWRGERTETGMGGWAVTSSFVDEQLSRAGNWAYHVPRFKLRQYRWETREEALEWARRVVDHREVNGFTFAQWQARRAAEDAR